jgi:hypothetical protein
MTQATRTPTQREESAFIFIGDAGPVTVGEFGEATDMTQEQSKTWLRRAADDGYLYRDEFGRYGTSCPIPPVGY